MTEPLTFASIKATVEASYPTPIASAFRRCRVTPPDDTGGRHRSLIDLFEVHVKFLTIVALQEARRVVPDLKERLPQKEKTLEFLRRPSLGGWVGLLRVMCGFADDSGNAKWLGRISEWYHASRSQEGATALAMLAECESVRFDTRSRTPRAELCNALVTYRNKQFAHAANLRPDELVRRLPVLEGVLAYLLNSASFLADMKVFYTQRVEVAPGGGWAVSALRLNGTAEEPASCPADKQLELAELYLGEVPGGSLEGNPVPLGPFLLWTRNEDRQRSDLYFYNDAWRTKLEYLSYTSGDFYYHRELHSGFSDLITLKLRPGVEEDVHRSMSQEERADRAESCLKMAILMRSQGRLEDGLEALEDGVEYDRQPRLFVEMARIQSALGDHVESIRQTVQNCLDIEPDNPEALDILSQLRPLDDNARQSLDQVTEAEADQLSHVTVLHAVLPQVVRHHATPLWVAIAVAYYSLSAGVEYLCNATGAVGPVLLQLACVIVLTVVITSGRALLLRTRLPLSLQLDSMRLERFQHWFAGQMDFIFGRFAFDAGRLRYCGSFRIEPVYWCGGILWTVIVAVSGFFLSGSQNAPAILWPKRFIDYGWIYALAYPGGRYVVGLTVFVYRYSRLSLKPMLSTINDDGLRSFGPLFSVSIALASIWYTTYWGLASIVVQSASFADFFFLGLASAFFVSWSLGLPLAIHRSAREARAKAVHIYSDHIEKAFGAFLADPGEDVLRRYQWLKENQTVIKGISTWPLSRMETLVVLSSNLLLLAVDSLYVVIRLGLWGMVWSGLTGAVSG